MAHTVHIGRKTVCLKDYVHICGASVIHPKIEREERELDRLCCRRRRTYWFPNAVVIR
jgi:hypothetical protein